MIKVDITPPVSDLIPSKIQEIYRPLRLPNTFYDFPPKHYKYIPKFDGEPENFVAKKHIQAFEHFIDIFEVEHDDVYLRNFFNHYKGMLKNGLDI